MKSKKGVVDFSVLSTMAISLLVFCIIIGLTFIVMDKFLAQTTSGSQAYTAVNTTINAAATIPTWLPIIIIVAIAVIILGLVMGMKRSAESGGIGGQPMGY